MSPLTASSRDFAAWYLPGLRRTAIMQYVRSRSDHIGWRQYQRRYALEICNRFHEATR
jgi:hypothetical protein